MKSTGIIIGCAALVIGVAAVQESRISKLQARISELESEEAPIGMPKSAARKSAELTQTKKQVPGIAGRSETSVNSKQGNDHSFEDTIRKIYENKAGLAMVREENRLRASAIYGRLIEGFQLSPEEEKHFIKLLAPSVGEQDRVGMELFNASDDEERLAIIDRMEKDQQERREAIQEFLNNEEDFETYEDYHARKSEYEQLPAITSLMSDIGSPLSGEQETQLIEAMFAARTETGLSEKWEGRQGFYQFGEPEVSKRFEKDWNAMQSNLKGRVGEILEQPQQAALDDHQKQIENFIMMGLRMAENMTKAKQDPDSQ